MIGAPIIAVLMYAQSGPLDFTVLGQKVGHASKEIGVVIAVLVFALSVWQYQILVRPDVRSLFGLEAG